jgi:hypothetical protein
MLVWHSASFVEYDTSFISNADQTIEVQATIDNSDINIYNICIPPASSCPRGYDPDFEWIFSKSDEDTIILGDFNAHHSGWFSTKSEARGDTLSDAICSKPMGPSVYLSSYKWTRCFKIHNKYHQ